MKNRKSKMLSIKEALNLLICLARFVNLSKKPTYALFFTYYLLKKLERLLKMQLQVQCIPDNTYSFLAMKDSKCKELCIDYNLYVICNRKHAENSNTWYYLCSRRSRKNYKVAVSFFDEIPENYIYVSKCMKLNINVFFNFKKKYKDATFFLIPVLQDASVAVEMKISLVSNPHDCSEELLDCLLKKHFSTPKFIRLYDVFSANIIKNLPELKYCIHDLRLDVIYFKVTGLKTDKHTKDGFVTYNKTTVTQESDVNSYIPCECICDISFDNQPTYTRGWPYVLKENLEEVQSYIIPFLQNDISINVKPVFLVEGPTGSGKVKLVTLAAETLGLHLLKADFSEVQSLTSAQTEAKLRIILHDAENCVPCLLLLQNIQVFGINSEGQKDDRVIASFMSDIQKIYSKKRKFPLIIIATCDDSEIPIDTERTFLGKIKMNHLKEEQKQKLLCWLVERKGLKHKADLPKISRMCSDFVLTDLEALVSHAIKNCVKSSHGSKEKDDLIVSNDDFLKAYEYMQLAFSDQIGAPRIPKVYWEDIGGLANLKKEILRRVEMPLLNIAGMGRSGLLLYGPPGTGKTLLAKAVATECQLHFLSVKGPELLNMYVGQSEKNVRQIFERARAASPSIIFFDELDSLAPNRGRSGDSGGVMDRVVSQLLAEMDGLESEGRIFVIGATNRPDLVDPALLRPGRFDKMLYVGVCADPKSQISVLEALTRKFVLEDRETMLEELVDTLPKNVTGADLYSLCTNAWLKAVKRVLESNAESDKVTAEDVVVTAGDFHHAAGELVPSVSEVELRRYEILRDELSSK